ncbi:hypothetical protein [Halohasta litorea]|uniref:Uncharacterized protein n=1 Tax=Halohasta litorea TaxID=869891 RepID=A0ABD6DEM1_9EURY|nr:hypothetical protein [Halohasta litorea]MEA1931651.1 hypothetical protein [Euryarchaeota archaeon]
MIGIRSRSRTDSLSTRCRRVVMTADRGWKATALGLLIVLSLSMVL